MVTTQELLSFELTSLQRLQYILTLADTASSSHALKSSIRDQSAKLDQLESQLQILSLQRGWDFPDPEPISKWLISLRFHYRKDSSIAEHLIRLYTDSSIEMIEHFNRWKPDDHSVRNLFQKYMDCCTLGIRQMHPFL